MTISSGHTHTDDHSILALAPAASLPVVAPRQRCGAGPSSPTVRGGQRVECGAQPRRGIPGDGAQLR